MSNKNNLLKQSIQNQIEMKTSTQIIILLISCVNISINANVYECNSTWNVIPGRLNLITASMNYLWGVNHQESIYMCAKPCTGVWRGFAGGLKQIDAGDDEVWGVNNIDQIFKRPVDGILIGSVLKES